MPREHSALTDGFLQSPLRTCVRHPPATGKPPIERGGRKPGRHQGHHHVAVLGASSPLPGYILRRDGTGRGQNLKRKGRPIAGGHRSAVSGRAAF